MAEKGRVRFLVNGESREVETYAMARLLDVLREDLRLTSVKEGCGEGECGACSVLVNGDLVNSCLVPALQAEGTSITTIEGLAVSGRLDRVQAAFLEHGGARAGNQNVFLGSQGETASRTGPARPVTTLSG